MVASSSLPQRLLAHSLRQGALDPLQFDRTILERGIRRCQRLGDRGHRDVVGPGPVESRLDLSGVVWR